MTAHISFCSRYLDWIPFSFINKRRNQINLVTDVGKMKYRFLFSLLTRHWGEIKENWIRFSTRVTTPHSITNHYGHTIGTKYDCEMYWSVLIHYHKAGDLISVIKSIIFFKNTCQNIDFYFIVDSSIQLLWDSSGLNKSIRQHLVKPERDVRFLIRL